MTTARNASNLLAAIPLAATLLLGACSDYSSSGGDPNAGTSTASSPSSSDPRLGDAKRAETSFRDTDPSIKRFFDSAYGYAVFPRVTKGAAGVGAAHGDGGVVYEQGRQIGWAEVTQITLGAQLGGQSYEEIIFFQTKNDLENFKRNNTEFSANASAVAASAGAAATADYTDGVAVFTKPLGGLMFEASIGGQKFKFYPI